MYFEIDDIELKPGAPESSLSSIIEHLYGVPVKSLEILKKSLDARKKSRITWKYRVKIETDGLFCDNLLQRKNVKLYEDVKFPPVERKLAGKSAVVVGSGPAGLFSALKLIDYGAKVTLVERGKCVEERVKDIEKLNATGELDLESNVLFGEGGAGTWSDGKLTSRIHKPGIDYFFNRMVEFGADPRIMYEAKPHIGTDGLTLILKNIRKYIEEKGSISFEERVTDFILSGNDVKGVVTTKREILADYVILASGHSARDMYELLNSRGVSLEKKGFAVGARIEHPAEFINEAQYGKFRELLPAADYKLVYNDRSGRGVYSFCMCPGGVVVNSSSEADMLCVNGMSYSKRDLSFSNSAIVVSVRPDDIEGDALAGIEFQRSIERKAFAAGGGRHFAPLQRASSFMKRKRESSLPLVSYRPGVKGSALSDFLPEFVTDAMFRAMSDFERKMPGFIERGVFIGAETRTSSPVRVARDKSMVSVTHRNLYPVGEGAGYAGGIVSSAVDGINAADAIASII